MVHGSACPKRSRPSLASLRRVFTGIVRERGVVAAVDGGADGLGLVVEGPETAAVTALGDSVAIDGVDLTATEIADGRMTFHAVPETLSRTTLGELAAGAEVNLEPALRAGEPFGGHFVQGHVDGVGTVRSVEREGEGLRVWIELPPDLRRYVVEKGSITVQGVSLTVADIDDDAFAAALIPYTLAATTLGALAVGDRLNLEVDVLAKYVERLLDR